MESGWVAIELDYSTKYVFELSGVDSGDGTLNDPYLRLFDANGNLLDEDDDSGNGIESSLTYTAPESSTYLSAGSYDDNDSGSYLLSTYELQENSDAAENTNTIYSLTPGESFSGLLNPVGDRDWVAIELDYSTKYLFELTGADSGDGTLNDPYLRLCRQKWKHIRGR